MDRIIEARAFVAGELREVEIGINDETGTIVAVKKTLTGAPRERYPGQLLLPSGVDWHVHFRDPGAPHKEDFKTGTLGAALGGIGTVLDMPNTNPLVDRPTRLKEKRDLIGAKACVDWGLWATATRQTPDVNALLDAAAGIKVFLAPTTGVDEAPSNHELETLLATVAQRNRWTVAHAEGTSHPGTSRTTLDHDARRPAADEAAAIRRLARLAYDPRLVHVAHVSSPAALREARDAGFSIGLTPHHLLLSTDTHRDGTGKVNPPLRPPEDRAQLWDAFHQGGAFQLESDHAPHTGPEKNAPFDEAPAGIPGVQTLLPLFLWMAKKGQLDLRYVINAACTRPGRQLGLATGRLEPGTSADFFLVDPRNPQRVRGSSLASKAGWTPYEGWEALFPLTHYLHGEIIVDDGRFVGRAGQGRPIALRDAQPA